MIERLKSMIVSYRAFPLWVQFWVFGILVPVNAAAIFFVQQPWGWGIAALAIGGMLPNAVLLWVERGFSKAMALSHVILWTPLVIWIGFFRPIGISEGFNVYLWLVLCVDLFSLAFDIPDSWKWWRGDRAVSGRGAA